MSRKRTGSIFSDRERKRLLAKSQAHREENSTVRVSQRARTYDRRARCTAEEQVFRKLVEIERLVKLMDRGEVPAHMRPKIVAASELLHDALGWARLQGRRAG